MTAKNGGGNGESSSWGVVAMAETHAPPPPPPSGRGASLLPIQPSFFSVHFLMQMTARSDPPLGLWYQLFCMAWVSVHRRSSASSFFFFFEILFFPSSSSVQIARPFKFSPSTLSHNELAVPFPWLSCWRNRAHRLSRVSRELIVVAVDCCCRMKM